MRVFTRVFSTLLAAATAAFGVLALIEITLLLLDRDPWLVDSRPWFDDASTDAWSTTGVRVVLGITLAVGLILLLVAWAPRRPVAVPVTEVHDTEGVSVTLRRRDVERRIASSARSVPHVVDAKARAGKRVKLVARTTQSSDTTRSEIESRVLASVRRLGLDPGATKVRVRKTNGGAAA